MRIDTPKIVIHVEIVAIISTTSKHKITCNWTNRATGITAIKAGGELRSLES